MYLGYVQGVSFDLVTKNSGMTNDIKELLENINWQYLSIHSLLDVTNKFPLLRESKGFKKIFSAEITRRLENSKKTELIYGYRRSRESAKTELQVSKC